MSTTKLEQLKADLNEMSNDEVQRESIVLLTEIRSKLNQIDYEATRIRKNVVFFFWMFILSFGFGFLMMALGGAAALFGLGAM